MKKRFLIVILLGYIGFAQVGIGTNKPNVYAQLDVTASDKGLLIPRVALDSQNSPLPIAADAALVPVSLLVFNTNDGALPMGYYYWDHNQWNQWVIATDSIEGPEGPEGIPGPQGPEGIPGEGLDLPGPQGNQGPEGPKGSEGPMGFEGDPGPDGDQGPVGPRGEGIDLPAPEGPAGNQGPQGSAGSVTVGPWNRTGTTTASTNNTDHVYNQGNVGVGGASMATPTARLQVRPSTTILDPLILEGLRSTTDPNNTIDGASTTYYDLRISENGVVRRSPPVVITPGSSSIIDLAAVVGVTTGTATGGGGTLMSWRLPGTTTNTQTITLPDDGAYIFTFRFYGTVNMAATAVTASTHYFWALVNGTITDMTALTIVKGNVPVATYSTSLTVNGRKGDLVSFRIAESAVDNPSIGWRLVSRPGNNADKTSMVYWKIL